MLDRMLAAKAAPIAERVRDALAPACKQIVIAGSLRRGAAEVKDIEIVAEPEVTTDLFGEPTGQCRLALLLGDMVAAGKLRWRTETHPSVPDVRTSRRVWSLVVLPEGARLDVFAVRPPAQWGVILAIRTGPAEYSQHLVTVCRRVGVRVEEGRVVSEKTGRVFPGATEREFFQTIGVPWTEPAARVAPERR